MSATRANKGHSKKPSEQEVEQLVRMFNSGKYLEVETHAKRLTQFFPKFLMGWKLLAAALAQNQRFGNAFEAYREWSLLEPNNPVSFYNAGLMKERLSDQEGAIAYYERALNLKPKFSEAINNLGLLLRKMGRLTESLLLLRRNVELNPDSDAAHYNLGNIEADLGNLDRAIASYMCAIEINSRHALSHLNLGNVMKDKGNKQEALTRYHKAYEIDPQLTVACSNIGILLFEEGRYEDAVAQLRLDDTENSYTYLLRSYFALNNQVEFYRLLDKLGEDGITNSTIGSLMFRAGKKFGVDRNNSFANQPTALVERTSLLGAVDFDNQIAKPITQILSSQRFSELDQRLLENGSQTAGNFFALDLPEIRVIESLIRRYVNDYRLRNRDKGEGFLDKWTEGYDLKGWIINMTSGGSLAPHIHENGWMGGAIYVQVPKRECSQEGSFVVCVSESTSRDDWSERKVINVETGDMVLFPASLMHYTIPFFSDEYRVVLAFDVLRK